MYTITGGQSDMAKATHVVSAPLFMAMVVSRRIIPFVLQMDVSLEEILC